jgi:hypothetical protein
MDFPGPDANDLAQVRALNLAFLHHLATDGAAQAAALPASLAAGIVGATPRTRRRLAGCPFLLFSIGELDPAAWADLFENRRQRDLLAGAAQPSTPAERLLCTAVAFLWQLAGHNPYAARVVAGAPADWCERLAACALVDAVAFAADTGRLLTLRQADDARFWRRLLDACGSEEAGLRRAARLWAFQSLLTRPTAAAETVPAAACRMPPAAHKVAERPSVSQSRPRRYNTPPHEGPVDTTTRKDLPKR